MNENLDDITCRLLKESASKSIKKESAISDMFDMIKDSELDKVDGVVDGVVIITDPDVNRDEYQEVIDNAQELIANTPEGDVPFDEEFLNKYVMTCPLCGSSFLSETIMKAGGVCPICEDTPEGPFILKGQITSDENAELEGNEVPEEIENEEIMTADEVNGLEDKEPRRELASKEIPTGNKLQETKEEKRNNNDDIELPSTTNGTAKQEIEDMLERTRRRKYYIGIEENKKVEATKLALRGKLSEVKGSSKTYTCIEDRQGEDFCVGKTLTAEEWGNLARTWTYNWDDEIQERPLLKNFATEEDCIKYIDNTWEITIVPSDDPKAKEFLEIKQEARSHKEDNERVAPRGEVNRVQGYIKNPTDDYGEPIDIPKRAVFHQGKPDEKGRVWGFYNDDEAETYERSTDDIEDFKELRDDAEEERLQAKYHNKIAKERDDMASDIIRKRKLDRARRNLQGKNIFDVKEKKTESTEDVDAKNIEAIKDVIKKSGITNERTVDLMSKDILKDLKRNYTEDCKDECGNYYGTVITDAFRKKVQQITGKMPDLKFGESKANRKQEARSHKEANEKASPRKSIFDMISDGDVKFSVYDEEDVRNIQDRYKEPENAKRNKIRNYSDEKFTQRPVKDIVNRGVTHIDYEKMPNERIQQYKQNKKEGK